MKKINVLHIAEIDNDLTKGTSTIIPQYIIAQNECKELNVFFLNCNNTMIELLKDYSNVYSLGDNKNMTVIRKVKPDIIIFHELYKPYYLRIYKYVLKENIPYIIIPHGGMTKKAQQYKRIKKIVSNFLLFNHFFKNANSIQYLSETEKNNTAFSNLNYFILGNGIANIPNENLYLKKHSSSNLNKIKFIYVGRYDIFIKGLDQLLEAIKMLNDNGKNNLELNFFGKGTDEEYQYIDSYIKNYSIKKIIKVHGPIYGDEKKKKMLESDVFIQVSRSEGQPLGVMEALSLGMPVILSEGTGYKKIINEFKIGISTKTIGKEIYDSILELMNNNDKLKEFSNNSYNYAKANYNWEIIVKKSLERYLEILK